MGEEGANQMTDLIKILNNPEEHYPGNFDTPQRANALLTGLCQDAANEIAKLQAEVLEQCRINGMSAEREDALRAELTQLKASIALDKMAENARELGLDYEPAPVQEGRDWSLLEATQESLREHMAEITRLKAAQPAPVQEPVAEVLVKVARFLGVVRVYAQDIQPKHELETDKPLHWKARELQDEVIKLIDTTPPAAQRQHKDDK
jgi:hypothetical protein